MTTQREIIDNLRQIAESQWKTSQQPVLLSNLPPLLAEKNSAYKDALGGKSLKDFISQTENDGRYKLITHPNQFAKLGLVPTPEGEGFQFPEASSKSDNFSIVDRSSEKALIDFLRALKKLPAQDLAEVRIPITVLVKMLK